MFLFQEINQSNTLLTMIYNRKSNESNLIKLIDSFDRVVAMLSCSVEISLFRCRRHPLLSSMSLILPFCKTCCSTFFRIPRKCRTESAALRVWIGPHCCRHFSFPALNQIDSSFTLVLDSHPTESVANPKMN